MPAAAAAAGGDAAPAGTARRRAAPPSAAKASAATGTTGRCPRASSWERHAASSARELAAALAQADETHERRLERLGSAKLEAVDAGRGERGAHRFLPRCSRLREAAAERAVVAVDEELLPGFRVLQHDE